MNKMAKKKNKIRINNSVFYITKEGENYYINVQDELESDIYTKYVNRVPICKKAYDELANFAMIGTYLRRDEILDLLKKKKKIKSEEL
jgi:hypothetical protein